MPDSRTKPQSRRFECEWQCGICVSVCKDGAISHRSEIFEIDLAACCRCMLCVRVCPAGVIAEDLLA